jgi:hypothetical protein
VLLVDPDGATSFPDLLGEPETSEAGEGGSPVLPQAGTGDEVGENDVDESGCERGEEGCPDVRRREEGRERTGEEGGHSRGWFLERDAVEGGEESTAGKLAAVDEAVLEGDRGRNEKEGHQEAKGRKSKGRVGESWTGEKRRSLVR